MAKPARKTVEVGTLLRRANYFLASKNTTAEEREVMCSFIEGVLFDTGNYRGFAYLPKEDYTGEADFQSDGTRRRYFVSGTIDADYEAADVLIAKHYYGRGV